MLELYSLVFVLGLSFYIGDCAKLSWSRDLSWDILIFSQHWPETACIEYMTKNSSHTCRYPKDKKAWSVHGIWPTKTGTKGPSRCNMSVEFDPEKIKSIETQLEQVWVDVHEDSPADDFWTQQWNKHGTCALTLPALDSEFKYFNQAILWFNKYSMTDILSGSNITPSNTKSYQVEDIDKAITEKLGVKPVISCYSHCGPQYIEELRICFDKQMNLKDCAPYNLGSSVITNCNVTQSVVYPEVPKELTKYHQENYNFNA